jgi:hypothetical protein
MKNYSKDFSKQVVKTLAAFGIKIVGATFLPDATGNFANGETGYNVNDNGTGKVWTYMQVVKMGSR